MESKLYIRDGKRFKYVPNMIGAYWNGTILTKERMQDSIAVVIEQHYDHVVMASLEMSKQMSWNDAKEWCKKQFFAGKGRLPSKRELISLSNYIDLISSIWGEEYDNLFAWYLSWINRSIRNTYKIDYGFVRTIAVIDIPILNLI